MTPPSFWLSPRRSVFIFLLLPFSYLYLFFSILYQRFRPTYRAPVAVICIGNAVVGGSGKTPVVLRLSSLLKHHYPKLAIVSRGYKGRLQGPVLVDPIHHASQDVGDEPLLLATVAPTWIGKNRRQTMRAAIKAGCDLLLLDDGLQDASVYKDLSFLVISGPAPFGNGHMIPAGPLREPLEWVLQKVQALIYRDISGVPSPLPLPTGLPKFTTLAHLATSALDALPSKNVIAFAGIAHPHRFFAGLKHAHINVIEQYSFPDHYTYTEADLFKLESTAQTQQAILVTTEKDYVRLPPYWRARIQAIPLTEDFTNSPAVLSFILSHLPHIPTERTRP